MEYVVTRYHISVCGRTLLTSFVSISAGDWHLFMCTTKIRGEMLCVQLSVVRQCRPQNSMAEELSWSNDAHRLLLSLRSRL